MAFSGTIALFVEGSLTPHVRRQEMLSAIWQNHIVTALRLKKFDFIYPIDKREFAAMDPDAPTSGRGLPLTERIANRLNQDGFDVAVVAWDLIPPVITGNRCRWDDSKLLYRAVAECDSFPTLWRNRAAARFAEMNNRREPRMRRRVPTLVRGSILTVCMEPDFESMLVGSERLVRQVLGLTDGGKVDWPNWDSHTSDPVTLLRKAIKAASECRPKSKAFKLIHGDMDTAKNVLGEYILRHIVQDEQCVAGLRDHPISLRLMELMSIDR